MAVETHRALPSPCLANAALAIPYQTIQRLPHFPTEDLSRWDLHITAITPVTMDIKMAKIFFFLKSGQPGAIKLADGDIMMSHWFAENGQYKTVASKIKL